MKRFLLTISALAFTASLASAECYYVATKAAPTKADAIRRATAFNGHAPSSCRLGTDAERGPEGHHLWLCEMGKEVNSCDTFTRDLRGQQSMQRLSQWGLRAGGLTPPGDGDYRGPNGQIYHYDHNDGWWRPRNR